jgi:hypothetical protein
MLTDGEREYDILRRHKSSFDEKISLNVSARLVNPPAALVF